MNEIITMASGCGTVGRAVTFETRNPRLESSRRQFYLLSTVLKKDVNKEKKRPGMARLKNCE